VGMARKPRIFLRAGDRLEITIEKIGTLTNRIVAEI
jgi:2-keto-4-pentenoate hydratase/2-oxohepta-3-ene-1,7-dioic acid hydratase in catechol pathway